MRFLVTLAAALALSGAWGCRRTSPPDEDSTKPPPPPSPLSQAIEIEAEYSTAQLSNDPDDPAIWVHPDDPARSLIIGTMKVAAPAGALLVFGMDGQIRQAITGIDRPNNVDVEYGFPLGGRRADLVVATERLRRQLRVFRVDAAGGRLVDLGGIPILQDQPGEAGQHPTRSGARRLQGCVCAPRPSATLHRARDYTECRRGRITRVGNSGRCRGCDVFTALAS